jgi:hypothetical protein
MLSGASSQCADTIRIAFGRSIFVAHSASSAVHTGSSRSIGAPCER